MTELNDFMLTNWFKTNYSSIDFSTARKVKVKLYVRGPLFAASSAATFATYTGVAGLSSLPEWVELPNTITSKLTRTGSAADLYLKKLTAGGVDYLQVVNSSNVVSSLEDGAGWYLTDDPSQSLVYAAVFYLDGTYSSVVNPIVMATTAGIGNLTVAQSGSVYGQFNNGSSSDTEFILSVDSTANVYKVGQLLLDVADPIWESAHAHHLWIQPQRTNFIANPSFERTGGVYWRVGRTSGTATVGSTGTTGNPAGVDQVLGNNYVSSRYRCGNIQGSTGSGRVILESNMFPKVNDWYSLSFYVSGLTGDFYYGLVVTDPSYSGYSYLRNRVPLALADGSSTSGFKKVEALVQIPDDVQDIFFRAEFTGTQFWLDDVLVDPHEGQYDYFDGESDDGLPGDFRWMGGSTFKDKHFSVWYNNYNNTRGRLIGDYDTNDNLYKPGLVEDSVPTGASVIVHWDAVSPVTPINWKGDAFYPISDVNGTSVSTINQVYDFNLVPITSP